MRRFCPQVTPSLVISLFALFVALGGTAIAATGGNFILGQSNTATTKTQLTSGVTTAGALGVTNTGGRPAANFISNTGVAPISVSNATRIPNLNADKLDGIDSAGFLPVGGKAADSAHADNADNANNANLFDNIDSTGFINGGGQAHGQAIAEAPGDHFFLGSPIAGFLRFSYACPSTLTNNGFLHIYNDSGSVANVFVDSGGPNPTYIQMAPGASTFFGGAPAGDSYFIQAQGALGIMTALAATVNRATDCHAQVQGVLTTG